MERRGLIVGNLCYVLWFVFYFFLVWFIMGATTDVFALLLCIYGVSIAIAFTPIAENIYRLTSGIRPLALAEERSRLLPIFQEVYETAASKDNRLKRDVQLYIQDTMEVNACAVGTKTVAVTRGVVNFMNDEELRGLLGHELGHLANGDTKALLITTVGNSIFSLLTKFLLISMHILEFIGHLFENSVGPIYFMFWIVRTLIEIIVFAIMYVGEIILMYNSRQNEYYADSYANELGYGENLRSALEKLQSMTTTGKRSIMDLLRSTHPSLIDRILRLEDKQGVESIDGVIS